MGRRWEGRGKGGKGSICSVREERRRGGESDKKTRRGEEDEQGEEENLGGGELEDSRGMLVDY